MYRSTYLNKNRDRCFGIDIDNNRPYTCTQLQFFGRNISKRAKFRYFVKEKAEFYIFIYYSMCAFVFFQKFSPSERED